MYKTDPGYMLLKKKKNYLHVTLEELIIKQ